jgi:hypothetical protein
MQQIQLQLQLANQGKKEVAEITHEQSFSTMAFQNALSAPQQQEMTPEGNL